jgi:hypothetical protein
VLPRSGIPIPLRPTNPGPVDMAVATVPIPGGWGKVNVYTVLYN